MNISKKLFTVLFLASFFAFVGCGDDDICDGKECTETQILDATTCNCVDIDPSICEGKTCPTGEVLDATTCECIEISEDDFIRVTANVTSNTTWTADKIVILGGRITVEAGATLTIEAGTVIKGEAGNQANATALLVARDGKIDANGTAALPIIFTSVADQITPEMIAAGNFSSPNLDPSINGLWGGIIVLGNAPISAQNENDEDVSELQIEGIPTSDSNGLYGGNNAADNSGTINYISIRHGGTNIGNGNEINGLTLGGVGSGTTISNVEVVANQDDGIEWFGGTVSASNVLVWNCGDDGLDTDQAWNGTCTNWVIITPQGGSGMELDGPEGVFTQGTNQFTDGTIYAGSNIDHLIDWDGNTNTGVSNVYFSGIDAAYNMDASGSPIESFGGDGTGANTNWEYTLPGGVDVNNIFTDGTPANILTAVSENANTVGANTSVFGWTWAGHSGELSEIGI